MATLAKPSPGNITQQYIDAILASKTGATIHLAIDFGWGNGTTVYAAAAGNLSRDSTALYGTRAIINHGGLIATSTLTRYAHLSKITAKDGWVNQGDPIGIQGSTGSAAKFTHLHFELVLNGLRANPSPYFPSTLPASGGGSVIIPNPTTPESETLPMFSLVPDANTTTIYAMSLLTGKRVGLASMYHLGLMQRVLANKGGDKMTVPELDIVAGYLSQIDPDAPAIDSNAIVTAVKDATTAAVKAAVAASPIKVDNAAIAALVDAALADNFAALPAAVIVEQKKPGN